MLSRGKTLVALVFLLSLPARSQAPAPPPAPPGDRVTLGGSAVQVGEHLFASGTVELEPKLAAGGAANRWTARVDGAETAPEALAAAWQPGDHTVGGFALDEAGGRIELAPVGFTVDTQPPAIRWEIRDPAIFGERGEPSAARRNKRPRRERHAGANPDLAWSADGRRWFALPWRAGQEGEETKVPGSAPGVIGSFTVASDLPQVFLRSSGPHLGAEGKSLDLAGDEVLWVTAQDAGAGVARLSARTRAAAGGGAVLELEAVDLVGNASRAEIALTP